MSKKIFALLLSVLFVLALLPNGALASGSAADAAAGEPSSAPSRLYLGGTGSMLTVNGVEFVTNGAVQPAATDGSVPGAAYDEASNTLTLSGYTGGPVVADQMGDDFTLTANGTDTISGAVTVNCGAGIFVTGNLTVGGSGTTTVTGAPVSNNHTAGILVTGMLTFTSGTMTAISPDCGNTGLSSLAIYSDTGSLSVTGGTLSGRSAAGYSSQAVRARDISVSGTGTLTGSAGYANGMNSLGIVALNSLTVSDGGRVEGTGTDFDLSGMGDVYWQRSIGILSIGPVLVSGGTIIGTGGSGRDSYGIAVEGSAFSQTGGNAVFTGGAAKTKSCGIAANAITYSGGALTAEASVSAATSLSMEAAPDASGAASYVWRTDKAGAYTQSAASAFPSDGNKGPYAELRDSVPVTFSLTGLTADGESAAPLSGDYTATLAAADHYTLPASVTVTANGKELTSGVAYDPATGVLTVSAASLTGPLTVTASAVPVTYRVVYSAGGGSGAMSDGAAIHGTPYTLQTCSFTPPVGKTFRAWSIGGTEYAPGSTYSFTADTTVTALWTDTSPKTGDSGRAALWTSLLVFSALACAAALESRKRRTEK